MNFLIITLLHALCESDFIVDEVVLEKINVS